MNDDHNIPCAFNDESAREVAHLRRALATATEELRKRTAERDEARAALNRVHDRANVLSFSEFLANARAQTP